MFRKKKNTIYLDHAAATPADSRVEKAMRPYWHEFFANPGGITSGSLVAREAIEAARAEVAQTLRARPQEIIFTNGGTESNNLAILGAVKAFKKNHPDITPHVVISSIEHAAVRETCKNLEKRGLIELSEIPVDEKGIIKVSDLKEILKENTVLVSVMYANNEIGTIQPIRDITKIVRWFKKSSSAKATAGQAKQTIYPLVHTDAIQATNYLDISVDRLGVDLLSISAAKIYGPKGIAVLYHKSTALLEPVLFGGEQENGLRPGTENTPLIVGMARALTLAKELQEKESDRLRALQKYFFEQLSYFEELGIIINGSQEDRLPNNINISISEIRGEQLVIELDARGIACSSQAACTSLDVDDSHVIRALRPDADLEAGTLRISMGRSTTKKDIDETLKALRGILDKIFATKYRFRN